MLCNVYTYITFETALLYILYLISLAVSVNSDPWPYVEPHSRLLPSDIQHIIISAQNNTYDAEDTFEMLKSHDPAMKFDELVEFLKQRVVEEAEEPESEPKERTMTVLKLTEGLGVTEAGINEF
jgi:hypothetical protein